MLSEILERTLDCRENLSLAMVYSIEQKWEDIYDPDLALYRGTLFKKLDKPFLGAMRGEKDE